MYQICTWTRVFSESSIFSKTILNFLVRFPVILLSDQGSHYRQTWSYGRSNEKIEDFIWKCTDLRIYWLWTLQLLNFHCMYFNVFQVVTLCAMLWSLPQIWPYYKAYIFPYWTSFLLPMVQIALMSSVYTTIIMSWERYVSGNLYCSRYLLPKLFFW